MNESNRWMVNPRQTPRYLARALIVFTILLASCSGFSAQDETNIPTP